MVGRSAASKARVVDGRGGRRDVGVRVGVEERDGALVDDGLIELGGAVTRVGDDVALSVHASVVQTVLQHLRGDGGHERVSGAVEEEERRRGGADVAERARRRDLLVHRLIEHADALLRGSGAVEQECFGGGGGMMAVLELFGKARADDGEVGHAVVVDDGVDGGGLVEVGSHVERGVDDLALAVGPRDGGDVARHADHGGVVAARGVASDGDLVRVELVRLGVGLEEADGRLDVLQRRREVRRGARAVLHGGDDVASLREREARVQVRCGVGCSEAAAVDPHDERRDARLGRGGREDLNLEVDGLAVVLGVEVAHGVLRNGGRRGLLGFLERELVLVDGLVERGEVRRVLAGARLAGVDGAVGRRRRRSRTAGGLGARAARQADARHAEHGSARHRG